MKNLLFVLAAIYTLNTFAQITFEKGYFLTNEDQKIDCFIKNNDWKNNPAEFEYQLYLGAETKKAGIENVKEFGVGEYTKYIRATVAFDPSSRNIRSLSYDKNPTLEDKTLFLRPLVMGIVSLYEYDDGDTQRFFFGKEGSAIQLLIYRKYLLDETSIAENIRFKRQLWNEF